MALDAMIFDLDGTLLDTNGGHVEAWRQSFEENNFPIPAARIAPEIGKGGDNLIPSVLGPIDDDLDQKLRDGYSEHFLEIVAREHFQIVPGARELLAELRKRGVRLALATSSKKDALQKVAESCGWNFPDEFEIIVTSDDATHSKPAPDVVRTTVEKLQLSPAQCAMIGDTPFDALACRDSGVVCLGVMSSRLGVEEVALRESGARQVYADCAALLASLDEVLHLASPSPISLSTQILEKFMDAALEQARLGMANGEAPIGAILARGDGEIIARGFNTMNASQMKIAHAEIVTFQNAAGKAPLDATDLILVSTLEPCVMCTGAAMEAAVDTIIYALEAPYDGGSQRVRSPRSPESQMPRIIGGVRRAQSRKLFEDWMEKNGDSDQIAFISSLLEATEK